MLRFIVCLHAGGILDCSTTLLGRNLLDSFYRYQEYKNQCDGSILIIFWYRRISKIINKLQMH